MLFSKYKYDFKYVFKYFLVVFSLLENIWSSFRDLVVFFLGYI